MEKHKLIRIILKDIEELNEIAKGLGDDKELSKFELDIALSKSKLIYQEFEFLKELNSPDATRELEKSTVDESLAPADLEVEEAEMVNQNIETKNLDIEPQNQIEKKDTKIQKEEPDKETAAPEPISTIENHEIANSPGLEETKPDSVEEEESSTTKKTVSDHFSKGKSLNDLLIEGKTLDQKIASSPIEKLESAIGLNDRFQYIRELFDNNSELFLKTVQQIDHSNNLNEAVGYLNSNFKWKKTDTSIQFAQLVKRRFLN